MSNKIFETKRWELLKQSIEWFEVTVYTVTNITDNFSNYLIEQQNKLDDYDNEEYLLTKDKILEEKELFTDIYNPSDKPIFPLVDSEKYCLELSNKLQNSIIVEKIRHAGYSLNIGKSDLATTNSKIYKIFYKGNVLIDLSNTNNILKELAYNELWGNIKIQKMTFLVQSDNLYKEEKNEKIKQEKLSTLLKRKDEMIGFYVSEYKEKIKKIDDSQG